MTDGVANAKRPRRRNVRTACQRARVLLPALPALSLSGPGCPTAAATAMHRQRPRCRVGAPVRGRRSRRRARCAGFQKKMTDPSPLIGSAAGAGAMMAKDGRVRLRGTA
jgi:hypothetical protein